MRRQQALRRVFFAVILRFEQTHDLWAAVRRTVAGKRKLSENREARIEVEV
jgi:hypothetical protein